MAPGRKPATRPSTRREPEGNLSVASSYFAIQMWGLERGGLPCSLRSQRWRPYRSTPVLWRVDHSQLTINADADPVKDAFSDLLKKGQRQMRYRLKKQYFNGIPANQKQTKFKDVPPTAIDIFKDSHCSSKSGFNESAKDAIAQMEAYLAQPIEEGKDPRTPVEAVAHIADLQKQVEDQKEAARKNEEETEKLRQQ
uniref:Uncharacterized protein n=1 Tax=Oryza punctata TaxID=4537 RepID=A0A0E0LJU8_ORYPU